jgi:dTDP-4-amino-4,6-dideoxy-D-galactose acyltransferase
MSSPTEREPICTYLEWDSNFFAKRIARLNRSRLDDATVAQSQAWCDHNRIDCLYFLADAEHPETPRLSANHGFLLVDIRMTLERVLPDRDLANAQPAEIRLARESDLATLRAIAASGHRDTRFYFDRHFDRTKCDSLYETWIENSFRGFAQAVLVAEVGGKATAYLTCHLRETQSQIGLVAVGDGYRGEGLGGKLVRGFFSWSRDHGATRAAVVTQGRNLPAQRLYQRNGFVSASLQLWYHRWFSR